MNLVWFRKKPVNSRCSCSEEFPLYALHLRRFEKLASPVRDYRTKSLHRTVPASVARTREALIVARRILRMKNRCGLVRHIIRTISSCFRLKRRDLGDRRCASERSIDRAPLDSRELFSKRSLFFTLTPSLRSKLFEPVVVIAGGFSVHRITTSVHRHPSVFTSKHSLIIRRLKNVCRIMRPPELLFISVSQPPPALRLYVSINNSELQPSRFSMSILGLASCYTRRYFKKSSRGSFAYATLYIA